MKLTQDEIIESVINAGIVAVSTLAVSYPPSFSILYAAGIGFILTLLKNLEFDMKK